MTAMNVAVCDSGVGNVQSVLRALARSASEAGVEATATLSHDPEVLRRADAIVVPGQGSFGGIAETMHGPLGEVLVERIRAGTPYLGICLGLQVLFEGSEEAEGVRGLGVFRGRVRKLVPGIEPGTGRPFPLPHIGWNTVSATGAGLLPEPEAFFYFAHSFAAVPEDSDVVLGTCTYGASFVAAVAKDNVVGVQFHPEKSQREGLRLLSRFFTRAARGS